MTGVRLPRHASQHGPNGEDPISGLSSTRDFLVQVDGAGTVLDTGICADTAFDYACEIIAWTILGDTTGSIVFDIWKTPKASYPADVGDSITASAKPTLSSAAEADSSTLTGWTTAIDAGDTLRFNIDSVTTLTRATLALKIQG